MKHIDTTYGIIIEVTLYLHVGEMGTWMIKYDPVAYGMKLEKDLYKKRISLFFQSRWKLFLQGQPWAAQEYVYYWFLCCVSHNPIHGESTSS